VSWLPEVCQKGGCKVNDLAQASTEKVFAVSEHKVVVVRTTDRKGAIFLQSGKILFMATSPDLPDMHPEAVDGAVIDDAISASWTSDEWAVYRVVMGLLFAEDASEQNASAEGSSEEGSSESATSTISAAPLIGWFTIFDVQMAVGAETGRIPVEDVVRPVLQGMCEDALLKAGDEVALSGGWWRRYDPGVEPDLFDVAEKQADGPLTDVMSGTVRHFLRRQIRGAQGSPGMLHASFSDRPRRTTEALVERGLFERPKKRSYAFDDLGGPQNYAYVTGRLAEWLETGGVDLDFHHKDNPSLASAPGAASAAA
jgi:hypothetical protein